MSNIKLKFNATEKFDEKVSLLTLLPEGITLKEISKYFNCTYHMFSEAKKLRQSSGEYAYFYKYFSINLM